MKGKDLEREAAINKAIETDEINKLFLNFHVKLCYVRQGDDEQEKKEKIINDFIKDRNDIYSGIISKQK